MRARTGARAVTSFCSARPSNAPALTSASSTLRFTLRPSTRSQKSNSDRERAALLARASRMASTAPSPTPLTAPRPKRIPSAVPSSRASTVKSMSDSLTSGGSTAMPIARASAMNFTTLSMLSLSHVSSAAMNSTG